LQSPLTTSPSGKSAPTQSEAALRRLNTRVLKSAQADFALCCRDFNRLSDFATTVRGRRLAWCLKRDGLILVFERKQKMYGRK